LHAGVLDRRTFIQMTGFAAAMGAARGALADELIVLGASPQELETPLAYFDRLITPTPVFFVRSHFGPPALDSGRKLAIEGLVKHPLSLTPGDLKHFTEVTLTAVLQCAGNDGRSCRHGYRAFSGDTAPWGKPPGRECASKTCSLKRASPMRLRMFT